MKSSKLSFACFVAVYFAEYVTFLTIFLGLLSYESKVLSMSDKIQKSKHVSSEMLCVSFIIEVFQYYDFLL